MSESYPSRGRRIAFLSVPYLVLLILIAAAELAVRVAWPRVDPLEWLVAAPEQRAQIDDRRDVRIFEADPLLFWRLRPNLDRVVWDLTLVSTNPQGVRYPQPIGAKAAGAFRIVCLGDSVTFGYRVPRVLPRSPEDYDPSWLPYPALVEARLRAVFPGRTIEVIPLAVPGYSSHQGRAWRERDIGTLRPDVVTACFGWNDIGRRARSDRHAMSTSRWMVAARSCLASSQLVVHLGMRLRGTAKPQSAETTMRVPRREYVQNLLTIASIATRHGATPVFIGPVYRDRTSHPPEGDDIHAFRTALRTAAGRQGIAYLEIPELTEDAPDNRGLFEEHIHPNQRGHKLIAERLLEFLDANRLLGDLKAP